jgi:predicted ATP-dependent serine protease
VLLDAARQPRMPYPRLDTSKDPGPVDWVVEGLIAAPDITVLWGDGGVSKSLFQQNLAVAIAEGHTEFLGLPLHKQGRVLYIDEENPEDVVLSRLRKLGLTDAGRENLYYVWYGGVHLDTEPDKFFDAVAEFQPEIVFLDSFSRLQVASENDAEEMNRIFTQAIYPVSRTLDVPVMALHHANKSGGMRGNTAIRNAADLSIKVETATMGQKELLNTYRLSPDKPRRGQSTYMTYKVVGLDKRGEETMVLDDEVRVELQSLSGREDPY